VGFLETRLRSLLEKLAQELGSNVEDKTLESFGEYKIKLAGGALV